MHNSQSVLLFRGDELLLHDDGSCPALETGAALLAIDLACLHIVGDISSPQTRCGWLPPEAQAPAGMRFVKLRTVLAEMADGALAIAGRAFQIAEWSRTHRFCGVCGTPTERVAGERCMRCPACGHMAYPRLSPAMMVLITRGDRALLARHAGSPTGRWSALAGFVEPGESVEETVHREVMEEVGLRVGRLEYFGSQSWPFPHSLMIAFKAEYLSGELQLDAHEIAEARWFGRDDTLPEVAGKVSIAGHLIRSHFTSVAG